MDYTRLFDTQNWQTIGDDTQYQIIDNTDEFIIIFCGSNSSQDWKNNFNFTKQPYKNMNIPFKVHRGFLKVWKLINDFFLDEVKDVTKPITIVGHSYGGAIATLCMEDIWFHYPEKRDTLKLITFGSPRTIGWKNYKKVKNRWENSIIYCNQLDLVSNVPPFLLGYHHVKKRTFINKEKTIKQFFRFINNHELHNYKEIT
jgi:predicted lipase